MKNNEKIFTDIYDNNIWGSKESVSGVGSELDNTKNLRKEINYLIKILNIKSILDAPCGDMNWFSKINLNNITYYSFDIVEDLINKNKENFKKEKNYIFEKKDVINEKLPTVDLIICRDLIIHFPIKEIYNLLHNFCNSGSKYLLITKCKNANINTDIEFGNYARRDLEKKPFNFNKPIFEFFDKEKEDPALNSYMALYKLNHIKPFIKNYFKNNYNFINN